ncbi:sigma-54-dependent Fis family transcriptional regulator [Thermanaerosceptrum fracticalcis]|uniref:Sigma-54-dependent Fis family transcriptional regulator n=1 Tax=Thermanaerosceptrum fracticalcis TaxID=1712410 RepID=A0A7G6E388_THEFR|nr:sigma-54-dependent Fis family transcriptional regulator [Thermanaerosceptrum fracticalcis]QNB46542.1 sigma-54-dependent Fis family transcriptional regulator [Thermanaerosceptrum fracticalcis]
MTKLGMIKEFVQQAAKVIAATLEVEVVIIDDQLSIVAGTGVYEERVGSVFEKNSISHQVLVTGKTFIIPNSKEHEACELCPHRTLCPDAAEIALPIIVQGDVIGIFGIVACNNEQKNIILKQEKKLVDFSAKISDLIGSAIDARQLNDQLSLLASEFQTVINSVTDGIIAINESGIITQVNNTAQSLLRVPREQLLNKKAIEIFKDPVVSYALMAQSVLNNQEIYAEIAGNKLYFLASMTPILGKNNVAGKGNVLVIRNMSEVKKLVGNYLKKQRKITFDDIKGSGTSITQIKDKARLVAASDSTILILGESGTGKELFARAIHSASFRADGPFVALNCGAIPESLLESELFGYDDGAFTGARRGGKAGRFELANGGTLFLDEVGDMPLHLQVKLLRVLEEKAIMRLGGTVSIPVDVRIITATNKDLEKMVQRGEFRQDLYYRFNVIPLFIPPLRNRREDISILMDYFRRKFNTLLGKNVTGFSAEAEQKLMNYYWPGNVRELENAIEYAINMEQSSIIQISSIPSHILVDFRGNTAGDSNYLDIPTMEEMEKELIVRALKRYGNTAIGKKNAAKALSVGSATLYRKIKKYKITDELIKRYI